MLNWKDDDRLAGALVEARLRVGQVLARDHDPLLDEIGLAVLGLRCRRRSPIPAAAGPAAPAPAGIDVSTRRNVSLAVLPSMSLQPLRILQARHLHQDAVDALALDRRLDRAELR